MRSVSGIHSLLPSVQTPARPIVVAQATMLHVRSNLSKEGSGPNEGSAVAMPPRPGKRHSATVPSHDPETSVPSGDASLPNAKAVTTLLCPPNDSKAKGLQYQLYSLTAPFSSPSATRRDPPSTAAREGRPARGKVERSGPPPCFFANVHSVPSALTTARVPSVSKSSARGPPSMPPSRVKVLSVKACFEDRSICSTNFDAVPAAS
jgi:hypothetical protein